MPKLILTFTIGLLLTLTSHANAQGVIAFRGAKIETGTAEGAIDAGTILVRDGKIEAVGKDLQVPITARVIDLAGRTVLPGFVDPYHVVPVGRETPPESFREVTFGGRTFRVPDSPAATPTSFARIIDGFDPRGRDWWNATRSGITTAHLVSSGVGQSAVGTLLPETPDAIITDHDGRLFLALTNESGSLGVLRRGLAEPKRDGGGRPSGSMADRMAQMRDRMSRGGRPGGPPPGATPPATAPQTPPTNQPASQSPEEKLWSDVRAGKYPLFVNVNNAASILYLAGELKSADKANVALVAGGDDLYLAMESLDPKRYTIIMPPRIDLIPNSQDRINVARELKSREFPLAFSLSLNQGDYQRSQDSPLFAVAMLVRAGLDRQTAIAALTSVPAKLIGLEQEVGTIEKGKRANFVVLDDDPFSATASIVQVFVDGRPIYEN